MTANPDGGQAHGRKIWQQIEEVRKALRAAHSALVRLEEMHADGTTSTEALASDWRRAWEHVTGDPWSGDMVRLRRVLRRLADATSADEVRRRGREWFHHCDDWTRRQGYPVEAFAKAFPSLSGRRGATPDGLSDAEYARRMREAETGAERNGRPWGLEP